MKKHFFVVAVVLGLLTAVVVLPRFADAQDDAAGVLAVAEPVSVFQTAGPTALSIQGSVDQFRAAGIRPDNLHAIAWDVAQLTISVLRKEGLNATPAQVRDGLMGVRDFYGGLGPYDFKASPQRFSHRSREWDCFWPWQFC